MSEVGAASLLEALPPEIFNTILGYIFSPRESIAPPTATTFRGYRFNTSILRVNKAINRLAKSYLHLGLTWVRLDINWHAFLIDPHWLGVPYMTLDRADSCKVIPYPYVHGYRQRLVDQDAPAGRIAVSIRYPAPVTLGQQEIQILCFPWPSCSSMSVLVLEADFCKFMQVMRMNELAYTKRSYTSIADAERTLIQVRIPRGQETKRHCNLVKRFSVYLGPYCNLSTMFVPSGYLTQWTSTSLSDTKHVLPGSLQQQILHSKTRTESEGISIVMFLKFKGDKYLAAKQRDHAFMCYNYAVAFEAYWQHHDLRLPEANAFWTDTNAVYRAFGAALSLNMSIAYVTSGFNPPILQVRRIPALNYNVDLLRIGGGPQRLGINRYIELSFAGTVCFLHGLEALHTADGIRRLMAILRLMTADWEMLHTSRCAHETSSVMGTVYTVAKDLLPLVLIPGIQIAHPVAISAQVTLVRTRLAEMRAAMRDADIAPLVWAVREPNLPHSVAVATNKFLPVVVVRKPEVILALPRGVEALRRARVRANGVSYPLFDGWMGVDGEKRVLI